MDDSLTLGQPLGTIVVMVVMQAYKYTTVRGGGGMFALHHARAAAEDAGDQGSPPRLDKSPPQDAVGHIGKPQRLVVAVCPSKTHSQST